MRVLGEGVDCPSLDAVVFAEDNEDVKRFFGALGNVNYLPAALAAWSSDILFGLVGGYLLLRTPT